MALGLKKGIKNLSNINLWAVFILCGIIFLVGPTAFMFNTFTDSVGIIATNFFRMSFYTDPIRRSMFPQWWTVFYWAWYWAYAPYMGVFIARVSRGRTFKETVLATLVGGSAGFVDAPGGDYSLAEGSDAIDAGTNAPPGGLGPTDVDGNARILGGTVDQGAFEFLSDELFADSFESGGG